VAFQKYRLYLKPFLLPISSLYGIITSIRNYLFDVGILPSVEFDFPVISVGNITVGGTGKTPHVEYLLNMLDKENNTALLSRGYKRKTKGFVLADKNSSPEQIGDESFQIGQKYKNIRVAVDEKRVHGIKMLKKINPELQCVVLDDAFQHRYVTPGISILLIDYYRPLQNDHMLPAGNLRECKQGIHRANIVIVTKVPHEIKPIEKRLWIKELNLFPYQFLYFSTFSYGKLKPVFGRQQKEISLGELAELNASLLLISGISNPLPLSQKFIPICSSLQHIQYPDHHEYTTDDLKDIARRFNEMTGDNKMIVTTEKDAVKLKFLTGVTSILTENMYFIPVEVIFLDEKKEEFEGNILNYVRNNKRISRLHS
jgi:tetraacyldisaccharide 4'-kinase